MFWNRAVYCPDHILLYFQGRMLTCFSKNGISDLAWKVIHSTGQVCHSQKPKAAQLLDARSTCIFFGATPLKILTNWFHLAVLLFIGSTQISQRKWLNIAEQIKIYTVTRSLVCVHADQFWGVIILAPDWTLFATTAEKGKSTNCHRNSTVLSFSI